jgi:TolB-like protein/Tfp pilus assembly protein PilF/predicted Ser/Thr protein kinase
MTEFRAVQNGERMHASPMMSNVLRVCRKCGAEIFADAPEGLCTACLFETGLDLLTNASAAAGDSSAAASAKADDCGSVKNVEASDGNAAPYIKKAPRPAKTLADFGDYKLLEEIGRGGQGVVYRARQKSLNRTVALKVIGLGHWATEGHLKRFRREAEAAASLDHSGIVPIYEVGEREGSCYFSMKLVEGGQLDDVVKRQPMTIRKAVELIAKVARTVHYAHEHSILHRDIKPGNILLDQKGEPHLTDFGLARLVETESTVTRTMEVLGTPSYMAPEQAVGNNEAVSSITDVYGIGAVLYQLLTGHPPFAGGTTYETIKLLLDTEPRQPRLWNSKIDRDLSTICLKCLEKDPKRRYSSAQALAEDLQRWLKHEPIRARRTGVFTRGRKWVRRNPTSALLAASLVALAAAAGWVVWKSEFFRSPPTTGIAVLPFENLDGDKANTAFADGVQGEILSSLARVADLKVISRTSVMEYRGQRNMHKIGQALHVSYLLEGSVSKAGGRIRLNTELIDTRTDTNIWSQRYERDLSDVFAVQSEIAQTIADQLHARLSPGEKAAIEKPPTKDLLAYDLYVRALALIDPALDDPDLRQDALSGIQFLEAAIAHDPSFLLAYCKLAQAHDYLYQQGDRTRGRLARADSAVKFALRLGPDSGEAHLSLALHLYWGYYDYDRARAELAIASHTLPNNSRIAKIAGLIDRRQGRWSEAVRELERSAELDPRNLVPLDNLISTYFLTRSYKQLIQVIDRRAALKPNGIGTRLPRASIDLASRADTRALHALLQELVTDDPPTAEYLAEPCFRLGLLERDPDATQRALTAATRAKKFTNATPNGDVPFSHSFWEGLVARMKGDNVAAHAAFVAARAEQEEMLQAQSGYGLALSGLGMVDAYLGRKEEALREAGQAVELLPVAKNALDGADALYCFAVICALTGERDLAFQQLDVLVKIPSSTTYGDLRLNPYWDSLRGDPRFEKIVASLAPK